MAMGKRQRGDQASMWVRCEQLPTSKGHTFYEVVNHLLKSHYFDDWVEQACKSFYADRVGRSRVYHSVDPSIRSSQTPFAG